MGWGGVEILKSDLPREKPKHLSDLLKVSCISGDFSLSWSVPCQSSSQLDADFATDGKFCNTASIQNSSGS